jgi:hypothetical protein
LRPASWRSIRGYCGTWAWSSARAAVTRNGNTYRYGADQVNGGVAPGNFTPVSTPSLNATAPFNAGLNLAFQKLTDIQYGILLHALQEDASADTLSAPRILTLNNQEASIIVGTKYPIINSDASSGSGGGAATITTSLRGYEDIGIQLNVLPQSVRQRFDQHDCPSFGARADGHQVGQDGVGRSHRPHRVSGHLHPRGGNPGGAAGRADHRHRRAC